MEPDPYKDEYSWPVCTNGDDHQIKNLLMAQIIPKNELVELAHKLHKLRNDLGLNQFCHPKKEDFYDAYSLHKLAEIKTKVRQ